MSNEIAQGYAREIDEGLRSIINDARQTYANTDTALLYAAPALEEWSVIEDLAHVAEFPPYWTKEMLKVVQHPGEPFGRVKSDPDRIAAIENHARDALDTTLERIEQARAQTLEMLLTIDDDQWEKTGVHSTRGEMNLHRIMKEFITDHIRDHAQQARDALHAVKSKS